MMVVRGLRTVLPAVVLWGASALGAQAPSARTTYHVKQIAAGAVYLDGGSDDGLKEGMHLKVSRVAAGEAEMSKQEIGDITIVAVATISAVCEIKEGAKPIEL